MTNTTGTLGHSTLEVGRIGLGCMGMSEFYGKSGGACRKRQLESAIDHS